MGTLLGLAALCIILIIAIVVWYNSSTTEEATIVASYSNSVSFFKSRGITPSKEISLDMPSVNETFEFVVDDYSKQFGFYRYNSITDSNDLELYKYSDLLDFNLSENGKQMLPGRGLMAAGGAFLFGIQGAIIGSVAGDKTIKDICTGMSVQIKINSLNKPLVSIGLGGGFEKTSEAYKRAKEKADEIIAVLTYIEANKNAEPIAPPAKPTKTSKISSNKPANLNLNDFLS